jgi:LysR family transcriptional activator of mexEF-oprN operon
LKISHSDLAKLDLNLLVTLDALLTERHVTRAAQLVGIGQPAMSHNLSRLRNIFKDELLTRTVAGMQPTPRALEMMPDVRALLRTLQEFMLPSDKFNAADATRKFRLGMTDGLEMSLVPTLCEALARQAPQVQLALFEPSIHSSLDMLDHGELDLCVGLLPEGDDHHRQRVLCRRQDLMCIFDPRQLDFRLPISAADLVSAPHVIAASGADERRMMDEALFKRGLFRTVKVETPHALAIPYLVCAAPLIGIAPRHVAEVCASRWPLVASDMDLQLPMRQIVMMWHESLDNDPGHRWFRGLLMRSAKETANRSSSCTIERSPNPTPSLPLLASQG